MFTIESDIEWEELEQQVRQTTLLGQPDKLPYADAHVTLSWIPSPHFDSNAADYALEHNGQIQATTKYVLRPNLAFQESLRQDLWRESGRDQLSLLGGLVLRNIETNERSVLVPPIIEVTHDDDAYVLDGAHRIWNDRQRRFANPESFQRSDYDARSMSPHAKDGIFFGRDNSYKTYTRPAGRLIAAIVVQGPAFPSYARPNAWADITVLDEVPADPSKKKDYRTDYPGGYKGLYRDFSHLGSSGLRGV